MRSDTGWLKEHIRDIADFPKPGVTFKDLSPLLADVDAFRFVVDALADHFAARPVDRVVGIEARGFVLAAPVAYRLGAGFVAVRKPGKLPAAVHAESYALEYGDDQLEIHQDALEPGDQVVIIDDVLATGGTAAAAAKLIDKVGGKVAGLGFVVELGFLGGMGRIEGYDSFSLIRYE
jgi:adenine phosphoribosyltransferase